MVTLTEYIVEEAALEWLGELGYTQDHGSHRATGVIVEKRASSSEIIA